MDKQTANEKVKHWLAHTAATLKARPIDHWQDEQTALQPLPDTYAGLFVPKPSQQAVGQGISIFFKNKFGFTMKEIYKEKFSNQLEVVQYYNPGVNLTDTEFASLFQQILSINDSAKTPIKHRLISKELSLKEIKTIYSNMMVNVISYNTQPVGFLLSPIILEENYKIVHAGLVVINHNHGANLLGLLSISLAALIARKFKKVYVTNISSVPSIIENFAKITTKPWPDPRANLIKPPPHYSAIFDILCKRYLMNLNHFGETSAIEVEPKRFIVRSNSKEMGFNTNFYELSRPVKFKYLSFCSVWIDYARQEDILQVGIFNQFVKFKLKAYLIYLKYFAMRFRKIQTK